MSYGVSAKKMVSALGDALKPRCKDGALIEEFEKCLTKGLPKGAPKGTVLEFSTGGNKLVVVIDSKPCGSIGSKVLCSAFANIYSDKNAVCSMSPISANGEVTGDSCGACTRARCGAIVGAAAGYAIGKLLG
eukprot:scaffold188629_cov36-Tisochrysis_lutea.AAC.2